MRQRSENRPVKARRANGRKQRTKSRRIAASPIADLQKQVDILTRELKEAHERQTATIEVLQVINSSPDGLEPVFETILEKAHSLCGVSHGSLQLYDGEKFRAVAVHGIAAPFADRLRQGYVPGPNLPHQRLLEGAPFAQVMDWAEIDDPMARAAAEFAGIRATLLVPLRKDKTLIGQIVAARKELTPFSEKEIALLQNFAAQAVIAIENARLFDETREALERQTATADILKVIASSPSDVQPVFDAIVSSAASLFQPCAATITTLKDGKLHWNATAALLPGYDIARARAIYPIPFDPERSPSARAILERQVIEIPDIESPDTPEFTRNAGAAGGFRSVVFVPLIDQDQGIGTIIFTQPQAGFKFSDKQLALVQTFADQAVIAIQNTRLFSEVQARTTELSESLQQQIATAGVLEVISRSALDLQTVFNTVAESAVRLCGADRAFIFRFDGELLRMVVAYNASAEFTEFVRRNPIRPGRHSGSARAALERRTVQIVDVRDDAEYSYGAKEVEAIRTLLGVPILKGDELFGVMMIYRLEVRAFTDRQIALIETFANQAAIAIENVRLFEAEQRRTVELAKSLDALRTAQDRLVQTEKLASLGQLTAGIAHEIKNPLNFVNNFSALSTELTDELKDVLAQERLTDRGRQEVAELTDLLKNNLEKVVQHGKRADSIVKNMLLHSRQGSGERRSADINTLVGESLNLAYHGARAEKAGFTITLRHDLDPDAGALELYPQEITRALLNLISNGFYAATRRKTEARDETFEPVLSATTRNLGNAVEIRIRDNGTGIPLDAREKIFNPFFTTKPTGEGTGLGLSMTHDIIVKQHGGRIEVETQPGEFTEFIITLPRGDLTAAGKMPE